MVDFKTILNKVCCFISRPLEEDPLGCVLFFLLSSAFNIIVSSCGSIKSGFFLLLFAFCQFYVFFFFITLSKRVYRVAKPVLAFFLLIYFTLAFFCYSKFRCSLSPDITSLILATNTQEAKELISVYFGLGDILLFIGFALIVWLTYLFSCKIRLHLLPSMQKNFALILLILTLGIIWNNNIISTYWHSFWRIKFDELTDLSEHLTHPKIDFEEENLPDRVVVIIGESFAQSHSSLYGYQIETNPRLGALQKDSLLFAFSQAESPAVLTIPSFKYILNTHLVADPDSVLWYETTTIIELLKAMGYTTHWKSNQAKAGMYDNVASAFAKICDTCQFVHDSGKDHNYDETLLGLDVPQGQKQAVFYHLMGQHEAFWCRYPSHFNIFTDSLYSSCPYYEVEHRRTYDNATLYNDYVCSEIISKYKDKDAIVFYFSDHGFDLFEIDGFHGHGRLEVPESVAVSKKIPFLVYLSSECKKGHPELLSHVIEKKDEPLCTDAFTHLVLWLLNVKMHEG